MNINAFYITISILKVIPLCNCACKIMDSGVCFLDRTEIMHNHNKIRSSLRIGPYGNLPRAKYMPYLEYNTHLATLAQFLAETCEFSKRNIDRWVPGFQKIGQNNLPYYSFDVPNPVFDYFPDWTRTIGIWEQQKFNYMYGTDFRKAPDFTQIIWANTTQIGCGYSFFEETAIEKDYNYVKFYVCLYGPGGNVEGQFPYEIREESDEFSDLE